MITVALIDEDPLFRVSLEKLLIAHDIHLIGGEAYSGAAGLSLVRQHKPKVVLINTHLPDTAGETVGRSIYRRFPEIAVIFLLNPLHWPILNRLIEHTPARGFLAKDAYYATVEAIQLVHAGKTYLQPDLALGLLHYRSELSSDSKTLSDLSAREYEIFALLAKGKTHEQIAESVSVSTKTVYNLKTSACKKLEVTSRKQICQLLRSMD